MKLVVNHVLDDRVAEEAEIGPLRDDHFRNIIVIICATMVGIALNLFPNYEPLEVDELVLHRIFNTLRLREIEAIPRRRLRVLLVRNKLVDDVGLNRVPVADLPHRHEERIDHRVLRQLC